MQQDWQRAVALYTAAARQGSTRAQYNLETFYGQAAAATTAATAAKQPPCSPRRSTQTSRSMRSAYSARGPAEWTGAVENFRRKIETVCATAAHTKSSLACPTGRRSKLWAMYCSHAQLWARSLHSTTNWFSYRSPRSGEFDRSAQWRHASPRPWLIRAQRFNGSPTGFQGLS